MFNDLLFHIIASGCYDPSLFSHACKVTSPPHSGASNTYFWYFHNCDSVLWVDILKYFGVNLPLSEDNFILLTNEYCTKSVNFMLELEEYKIIRRNDGLLLEAWIIENKIKCKSLDLFGNTYIIINPK